MYVWGIDILESIYYPLLVQSRLFLMVNLQPIYTYYLIPIYIF